MPDTNLNNIVKFYKNTTNIKENNLIEILKKHDFSEIEKKTIFISFFDSNKYENTLGLIYLLRKNELLDYLFEYYIHIKNVQILLVVYAYFLQIDRKEEIVVLNDIILPILSNNRTNIHYENYDFLWIFVTNNNLNMSDFKRNIGDKKYINENYVNFNFKTNEDIIYMKKTWMDNYSFILNFDIKFILKPTKKDCMNFLAERGTTSSSMITLKQNNIVIKKIIDFDAHTYTEYLDLLKDSKLPFLLLENNEFEITSDLSFKANNFNEDKWKKVLQGEEKIHFSLTEIIGEKSFNINLARNKNLNFQEILILSDLILKNVKNYSFYIDKSKNLLFHILSNIKSLDEISQYKNIEHTILTIFIEQFYEYHKQQTSIDTRFEKSDLIILIEPLITSSFLDKVYLEITNTQGNNSDTVNKILLMNILFKDKVVNYIEDIVGFEFLIKAFKGINSGYYEIYKQFSNLVYDESIKNLVFSWTIDNLDTITIIDFYQLHIQELKAISDNTLKSKFLNYIVLNKNSFISNYNDLEIIAYLVSNGEINNTILEQKLSSILTKKPGNIDIYHYLELIPNLNNYLSTFDKNIEFRIRFEIWNRTLANLEVSELSILNLLNNFSFDILTDVRNVKALVKKNNTNFFNSLMELNSNIELIDIIFEIAKINDIEINSYLKENFYTMFVDEVDDIFEI